MSQPSQAVSRQMLTACYTRRSHDFFASFTQELAAQSARSGRSTLLTDKDVISVLKALVSSLSPSVPPPSLTHLRITVKATLRPASRSPPSCASISPKSSATSSRSRCLRRRRVQPRTSLWLPRPARRAEAIRRSRRAPVRRRRSPAGNARRCLARAGKGRGRDDRLRRCQGL